MENSRSVGVDIGSRVDCPSQGDGALPEEDIGGVVDTNLEPAMGLTADDDEECIQESGQLYVIGESNDENSIAELELYIQQCHQRIGEFDQELKQRDHAILQLGDILRDLISTVMKDYEEGKSAEDSVESLKTRVNSAAEYLSILYKDGARTEKSEYPSLQLFSGRIHASVDNGANKDTCTYHCQHAQEINEVKEQVLDCLKVLHVPTDILAKQQNVKLAGSIEQLSSQACIIKLAHKDALAQLNVTKEENESLKSELLQIKEESSNLKAEVNELKIELKAAKDHYNTLQQNLKGFPRHIAEPNEGQSSTKFEDRGVQTCVDLGMMSRLIENSPDDLPKLSHSKNMLSDSNLLRKEDDESFIPVSVSSLSSNGLDIRGESINFDGSEQNIHGTISAFPIIKENLALPSCPPNTSSKMEKSVSNEVKIDLEIPVAQDSTSDGEVTGKESEKYSPLVSNELEVSAVVLDGSNFGEHIFDLGAKAKELSVVKNQLKVMKEREESLKSQLSHAMDYCDEAEKRCKNAEKLAIDLQNDLENLLCSRRMLEDREFESSVDILKGNENEMSLIKSYFQTPINDDNPKDVCSNFMEGTDVRSMETGSEYIPNILHRFWNELQLTFDVIASRCEEKTDLLFLQKIAPLKTLLENCICRLDIYIKRKTEVLRQTKMLLEAESFLKELKSQVASSSASLCNSMGLSLREENENDTDRKKWMHLKNCTSEVILKYLNNICEEMNDINSKVIKCVMHYMEQEHEKQIAELKMHHAKDVTSLKQFHVLQIKNLMKEVQGNMMENLRKTEEIINSKSTSCWEVKPTDTEIKEDNDLKVHRDINTLKLVHEQEMEALKSELEQEKLTEILFIRQEINKSSKNCVNEVIKAVESSLRGLQSRCFDIALKVTLANEAALDDLTKKVVREFQLAIKELGETWLKKLEKLINPEVEKKEEDAEESPVICVRKNSKSHGDIMSKELECHPLNPIINLHSMLIYMSEGHIKKMADWQYKCMKDLMEKLHSEQIQFKLKLMEAPWNIGSPNIVPAEDCPELMESKLESYSVNQDIRSIMGSGNEAWINDIQSMIKDLKEKHAKEMESLRLYFEKKCAELEKRYSEDLSTRQCKKCSHSGSVAGCSDSSMLSSAAELESDHFLLSSEDPIPTRNFEEHEQMNLDLELMDSQGISCDNERVSICHQLEQSKNIYLSRISEVGMELSDGASVGALQADLNKILVDRDRWKKASQILRILLNDVLEYTLSCENELNDTLVKSILRLSGVWDSDGLLEGNTNGATQPRRVHIVPERLPNILHIDGHQDGDQEEDIISCLESSGEGIKIELAQCLARLRAEANALLGLSTTFRCSDDDRDLKSNNHSQQDLIDKISLLENHLKMETMEKDKLKVELHSVKGLCEGHASTIASVLARATEAEGQLKAMLKAQGKLEMVAEGFGEAHEMAHVSRKPQKMAKFGEKAHLLLKTYEIQREKTSTDQSGLLGALIAQLVEEISVEGDRLAEESRKEKEELQLQVEAADKQLRSTRAFLEEQAVERELEREEFQRELQCLQKALGGREQEKADRERILGEEMLQLNEKDTPERDPPSWATVERLEQNSKELAQVLQQTTVRKEELELELKAALDKVWDLREIIRELEGQVEGSVLLEKNLRAKNESLTADMTLQSKKLNDLIEELESLRSSLGYSIPGEMENEGHTALLEEALRKHCLQVEQARSLGPSIKDLTCKLLGMGQLIDKRTKELEAIQVTLAGGINCSSPSEDVSVREQLDQATWRSESPMEDENLELSVHMEQMNEKDPSKSHLSHAVPQVPLTEFTSLQEKFSRHCQAQEPLLKRIHDLEMQLHSLRRNAEELITEREVLQSQVEQQLLHTSELQARLDEARQRGGRQVHCMPVTSLPTSPLTRSSPVGFSPSLASDQPFFCCAALVEAKHEIENVTEHLEKKELEITQLMRALENAKKVVSLQEKQLMNKALEEAQTFERLKEFELLKSEKDELQKKLSLRVKADVGGVTLSTIMDSLLAEKNEEIDFLALQLSNFKEQLLLKSNDDSKITSNTEVQPCKQMPEDIEPTSQHSPNDVLCQDVGDMEVLRECLQSELSIERAAMIHSDHLPKQWFHSTKLEVQTSYDSPGLTVSPVTPSISEAHYSVNKSLSKEESPKTLSSHSLPDSKPAFSGSAGERSGHMHMESGVEGTAITMMQDAETQTSAPLDIADWNNRLREKEEEINGFKIKVDGLIEENSELSSLVVELREKVVWHSQHLEKLEEESIGRDSLVNDIKAEKESLCKNLQKYEQEVSNFKISHCAMQEKIVRQEEQLKLLNEKIEKYTQVNKDQHRLLKAVQQEKKEVLLMIGALSLEYQPASDQHEIPSNSLGNQSSNERRDGDVSQRCEGRLSPVVVKNSIKEAVVRVVDEVNHLRSQLNSVICQRDSIKQELSKALQAQESLRAEINAVTVGGEMGTYGDADETDPTLEHGSLEHMMEKVQQEGIEVLSLSEIAACRKSTSEDATPLGSPLLLEENQSFKEGVGGLLRTPQKRGAENQCDEERMQLLLKVQALQDQLACKEREGTRKRDWLEFQEKEGSAGWAGMVEAIGQKQRHELDILERLGEQRNARARLEAEVTQLKQQLGHAEAEARKAVYRLGMERSHVIRLESALQQEKANFAQLQVSLDTERKRSNVTKELNAQVNKAVQDELSQYQTKLVLLQESLEQEHGMRKEMELQVNQLQMELVMYQEEIAHLRCLLDVKPENECRMGVESTGWNAATTSPPITQVGDNSFNAEDMLQNLKGINQVLGWHVRNKDDYQNPTISSLEKENKFLGAKCFHLEQKLISLQDVLAREHTSWANERALLLRNQKCLFEMNHSNPPHTTSKQIWKIEEVFQKLYSYYWRSERNRKALAWQKRYFISLIEDYYAIKHQKVNEHAEVTGEQSSILKKNPGRSKHPCKTSTDPQIPKHKLRGKKSFKVVVWIVIATLKMKVLVLRSVTGIHIGSRSLLEEAFRPVYQHTHLSPFQHQAVLTVPCTAGALDVEPLHKVHSLTPPVRLGKKTVDEIKD